MAIFFRQVFEFLPLFNQLFVRHLQISSSVAGINGAQYQRSNDGRVSYAQDLSLPEFDRAYSYDQMGRVTQGLTGAEARGSTSQDGPYKQTYSYDAFNNLTSRTGRHWTRNVPAVTSSFVNNRTNPQWQYDADGRPTQVDAQQFKYDAAGRQVAATGPIVETYDGDGVLVKQGTSYPHYELPSSAVGGQALTRIDWQGQKDTTYTFANQKRVGRDLFWEIDNPINSGSFSVGYGSAVGREKELSPIGDNVGVDNPYLGGGDPTGGYPLYGGDASSFKCAWDGLQIDCQSLNKFYISKNWTYILSLTIHQRFGGKLTKDEATLIPGGDHIGNVFYGEATMDQKKGGLRQVYAETGELTVEQYYSPDKLGGKCPACPSQFTRASYYWQGNTFRLKGRKEILPNPNPEGSKPGLLIDIREALLLFPLDAGDVGGVKREDFFAEFVGSNCRA